jgi:HK97 family phage major capsid protein
MRTQEQRDEAIAAIDSEVLGLLRHEKLTAPQEARQRALLAERQRIERENIAASVADGRTRVVSGADRGSAYDDDTDSRTDPSEYRDGRPLTRGQTFAGYVRSAGLVPEREPELSLTKVLRGISLGDWTGAEAEQRAMSGASGSAGGYLLPVSLSATILDKARAKARVLEAGARVVPMTTRQLDVAVWTGDPALAWHSENAVIATSDGAVDKRTLTARTLAGLTPVSLELLEDGVGVEDQLVHAFVSEVARLFDRAALYGTGVDPEPRGIRNSAAVGVVVDTTTMGANGGTPTSYDPLIDLVGTIRDADEEPTAVIYSSRSGRVFGRTKDTSNQPLTVPAYLDGVKRLESSTVPSNLTQGTSTDASDVFAGDFRQLLLGVRTQLRVDVVRELYRDRGQVAFAPWFRGDVAVGRGKAFRVLAGVRG